MARIRKVEIARFRGIRKLTWCPSPGINCLIGPGDSGKSSILDAIDLCLCARRSVQFTDADFYRLDIDEPFTILLTLGELDDGLRILETYGMYLRSFDPKTEVVDDEPKKGTETVLTVKLTVSGDLEPVWSLVSDRAEAQGMTRDLAWSDRVRLAPTRIGATSEYHLGWRRGSVLNRLSDERADITAMLAKAARDARLGMGDAGSDQLVETLAIVANTAKGLGVPIGEKIQAMLDTQSVSFTGGTVSLHDEGGVPLRGLGTGSIRLLIAGLQRRAAAQSTISIIDELEHGLEPHRIIRLLGSLGAKDSNPPLQVFMATHSPVVLRELTGNQLFVTRSSPDEHRVLLAGNSDAIQGTLRRFPDAFLAPSVIICEGASEVGFVRGLDQFRVLNRADAITARGTALVDSGGGSPDTPFERAAAFRSLGYRTAVIRDDDKKPTKDIETSFMDSGGLVIAWRSGRALEDELFLSLSIKGVTNLLNLATQLHGDELVNDHIKSVSSNSFNLGAIRSNLRMGRVAVEARQILGRAARTNKNSWFKSVTRMEDVARDIVGPDLPNVDKEFRRLIANIFKWVRNGK